MSNNKILITGGSGMLGEYLNLFLSKQNEILTTHNSNTGNCLNYNSIKIDLTDFDKVEKMVRAFKPDVIVHTAAISRIDLCDKMPYEEVYKINSELPQFLSELCNSISAKIIYTSTDLVYDGEQGEMLSEEAKINPVTVYAETKYKGEELIRKTVKNYIILRQSLMYGFSLSKASNYFQTMFDNFKEGRKTKLFYDQYRTPMSVIDSARLIAKLCDMEVSNVILNWGSGERVNRVELAEELCVLTGFDKSLIESVSMDDIPNIKKVKDVSLSIEKIKKLGLIPLGIKKGLREVLGFPSTRE
jgi:dTDP-4-dehydrorhamnose reductase